MRYSGDEGPYKDPQLENTSHALLLQVIRSYRVELGQRPQGISTTGSELVLIVCTLAGLRSQTLVVSPVHADPAEQLQGQDTPNMFYMLQFVEVENPAPAKKIFRPH